MKVLLAVSGGIDSMYMLHRAPELFPGASFAAAHCNFALRGAESDGDEAFVRQACEALGIPCFVKRFATAEYASYNGVSVEMAARDLRYAWFRELCTSNSFDALATAHNANDNAETMILNLLRGTGTKGMRGIAASGPFWFQTIPRSSAAAPRGTGGVPPETPCVGPADLQNPAVIFDGVGAVEAGCPSENRGRPWPPRREGVPWGTTGGNDISKRWEGPASEAQWEGCSEAEVFRRIPCGTEPTPSDEIQLLRPLLGVTREEIRKWMEENGYEWREDSTNAENEVKRNKIRNQVFPVFAQINPSFIRTLGEDMQRIRQTDDIAEDYYQDAAAVIAKRAPGISEGALLEVSVPGLLALKHWRYVLWRILEDCSFSAETFEKLCTLLERYRTEPSGTVTLSGKKFESPSYRLSARRKTLILSKR